MSKRLLFGAIAVFLVLISSEMMVSQNSIFVSAAEPSKLKIDIGPTSLPADNSVYDCISIQLLDAQGKPARATQDVPISLSSSLTNIGDLVNSELTIAKGSTYGTAQFKSTFSPGTTTITATSSGYATVQAKLTTVGPIPSVLVVYGFPAVLPADGRSYKGTVVVQLQDSNGIPAKAPNEGVAVTLASSNTVVGTVDQVVTIKEGETFAQATFTSTMTPGTVSVTAVASGYTSKQATFTTQEAESNPSVLQIFLGPPKVPADRLSYKQIAVELKTDQGKIGQAPKDMLVNLASSAQDVGNVEETIVVKQGESYGLATFQSTYKSGPTTITATATDFRTTESILTTVGNVPSKLAVYAIPQILPSDDQSYQTIQVQLQDSSGKPAKDPNGDITINLFSSTSDAGDVTSKQLNIPFGETSAQGNFTTTYTANSTTITAQASNYDTGQTKITTSLIDDIPLSILLTPESTLINPGKNMTIKAYVTLAGKEPASGTKLTFNSTNGGNFSAPEYIGDGTFTTTFTAPKTTKIVICSVIANATKANYISAQTSKNITVNPSATMESTALGTIQIQVTQDNGNPLSDAAVFSISQPTNALPISGITNDDGYATFSDVTAGYYQIQITKSGYTTQEQNIVLISGTMLSRSVPLTQEGDMLPLILAIVAVVVTVVVVVVILIVRRRGRQADFMSHPESGKLDFKMP
jgi:hypothetical protein